MSMINRNSIVTKIITLFCLIISCSLIVMGIISYFYNYSTLKTQYLNDEVGKLESTSNQMEYYTQDIQKFAVNAALDSDIQSYLKKASYTDYYAQISAINKISDKLSMIEVQREYVYNFALVKGNEVVLSKQQFSMGLDQQYFQQVIKDPWYTIDYSNGKQSYFSTQYVLQNVKILPYIFKITDIYNPSVTLGKLVVNINYGSLEQYVRFNGQASDNFFWLDSRNTVMYQSKPLQGNLTTKELLADVKNTSSDKSKIYTNSKGYLIVYKSSNNGWTYVSFLTYNSIFKKIQGILYLFLLFTFLILAISIIIILPTILSITKPLVRLNQAMGKVSEGNLDIALTVKTNDEVGQLTWGFNKMLSDMKNYISKTVEYEKEKRNIELNLLVAQINPHFIYNTLNTVIYMASKIQANDIVDMVRSFIAVLHDTVKINDEMLLTDMKREIEALKQYLNIQKYRYQDRFEVIWNVDESLLICKIPRTILQPIVENSLLHGILPDEGNGIIKINISSKGEDIIMIVEDNGVGMDSETVSKILTGDDNNRNDGKMRSIGIHNVVERIKYICGEKYGIYVESEIGIYSKFTLTVPKIQ
jgi:two-component system sensor histidine kinase YesM